MERVHVTACSSACLPHAIGKAKGTGPLSCPADALKGGPELVTFAVRLVLSTQWSLSSENTQMPYM